MYWPVFLGFSGGKGSVRLLRMVGDGVIFPMPFDAFSPSCRRHFVPSAAVPFRVMWVARKHWQCILTADAFGC